ncbi:MAG: FRG domain-containing protein [Limnohabitans sp.]
MEIEKIYCDDAHQYFKEVEQMSRRSWVYRGHSRYAEAEAVDWKLESSLNRFLKNHHGEVIKHTSWYPREQDQIKRFQKAAHLHLSHLPSEKNKLEWLALMQHYGGPTRLLDFTFNPAAALYFSLRKAGKDTGPYSIHALHIDSVRKSAQVVRKKMPKYEVKNDTPLNPSKEEYKIGSSHQTVDFVGFFDSTNPNPRQEAQDGIFMIPSRIDLDIEGWLKDNLSADKNIKPRTSAWVEFIFKNPKGSYYKVVNQLLQTGMSAKRLFPGLEGISESMKHSWFEVAKNHESFEL